MIAIIVIMELLHHHQAHHIVQEPPKPGTDLKPYRVYKVNKPLTVKVGEAAPWIGYEGNRIRYEIPERIITLEKAGI